MPGSHRSDELEFAARMVRIGRLRPDQFAAACSEWLHRPDSSLGELLRALGWPPPDGWPIPGSITTQPDGPGPDRPIPPPPPAGASTETVDPPDSIETVDPLGSTRALVPPGPTGPVDPSGPTELFDPSGSTRPLDPPGQGPTTGPAAAPDRYHRLDPVGKGGLGLVWRAIDRHLGREVALKEPRPDRPVGSSGSARFLEEARVTGQLQHPGIVPLFDLVDEPALGGPFYTMRLVEGRTLKQAAVDYHEGLGDGRAGPSELVGLLTAFVSACLAVAYAHARGVLHRDLKGANVILGDFGEVHVLDWGLAKLSGGSDPESESESGRSPLVLDPSPDRDATLAHQAVGTPGLMAPEQTGRLPGAPPPDHRTDVYGLGATLYEILTGRAPFHAPTQAEVLRLVCEQPPVPPRQHNPAAPPALQAVCLKALAKDPADRYGSAAELADEVRRWLADEPVRAYPEPPSARLSRWGRRHRSAVLAAAVVLVAVSLTLAAAAAVISGKNRALAVARDEAREAAALAVRERDLAEENLESARDLALDMLGLSEDALAQTPGAASIRKRLVVRVLQTFRALHDRRPDDPGIRRDLAEVLAELAKVRQLLDELVPSTEDASASIRLLEGLLDESPGTAEVENRLAELLRNQSDTLRTLGRLREASDALARAAEISRRRLGAGPDDDGRRTLGSIRYDQADLEARRGRLDASLRLVDEALDLLRALNDRPDPQPVDPMLLGLALDRRGRTLTGLDWPEEAERALDEGIAHARAWLERTGGNNNHRWILSLCLDALARLLAPQPGRRAEAEAAAVEAVEQWRANVEYDDDLPHYRAGLADALAFRGGLRLDAGDLDAARQDFDAALGLLSRLLRESPGVPAYRGQAGRLFAGLGRLSLRRDDPEQAVRRLEVAVAFLRLAVEGSPEDDLDRRSLESALDALESARRRLPP
ncbi:serine/threonine-protein kinase [Tautonia plasticadhaerens]|uniref:Serine/threonine-protein kinase PknD n=1 Tax=Tautonia plasticadhaerens TaxID=2527974 RepID=A0A518H3Q1_9BACT|nr:serine/threonine-protein kinase [Tautonia plasticadhaerens]QDV35438.1 Serine/threonine-protein kinase PknD [Tautonia plasticadhaerens]